MQKKFLRRVIRSGNCKCGKRLHVLTIKNEVFYFCARRKWYNFWRHERFRQIVRLNPVKNNMAKIKWPKQK